MRMISDIALSVTIVLMGGGLWAATPMQVFELHKDDILSGKCAQVEGFSFGVGLAKPRTDTARSAQAAMDKARLAATANLTARSAMRSIIWPDSLTKEEIAVFSVWLAKRIPVRAKLCDLETVMSECGRGGICTAVVAVSDASIPRTKKITIEDAFKVLLDPYFMQSHFKENRKAFYSLFAAAGRMLPKSLEGVDFNLWSDEQIRMFCGIPRNEDSSVSEASNGRANGDESTSSSTEAEEIVRPEFVLPPLATANENETIGF